MGAAPKGTFTFLFTDIEGSTELWERRPDSAGRAIARHDELLREAIRAEGGTVFSTAGDGYHAAFSDAHRALIAAINIQQRLAGESWTELGSPPVDLRVRIGIHTGIAERRDGAFFGPPLNRTARLTAAGHGGQVLLSLATQQLVRDGLPDQCSLRDLGLHRLKDLHYSEHIFQLVAPDMPVITRAPSSAERIASPGRPIVEADLLPADCPYRGLRAFREEDAPFFFGREAFSRRLQALVSSEPLAAVIGPSGSGKSSVMFAGLLPSLRGATINGNRQADDPGWDILDLRPGRRPFHALARALYALLDPGVGPVNLLVRADELATAMRQGAISVRAILERLQDTRPHARRLLLVADQFEELYTLCPDDAERRAFQDTLFDAAPSGSNGQGMTLALTLRADFMDRALAYRPFADAVQDHNVVLGPMNRVELVQAVSKPAELQGRAFETGLVERIIDDVERTAGTLPLLQFALTQLWDRQEGGWLTHRAYDEIGHTRGAIAQHADAVYAKLTANEQERARRVFVQLVSPGEGTGDTRRLATRNEIGDAWEVVTRLADERLVVTNRDTDDNDTAELVHEELIRSWLQLRRWLQEDRRFRSWQDRMRFGAAQWQRSDRDQGALLRGAPLAEARAWLDERGEDLAPFEHDYVTASLEERRRRETRREEAREREIAAAKRVAESEHRRAAEQSRAAQHLRLFASGMLVVAAVAGLFWQRAAKAARIADVQRIAATGRTVSLEGRPRRGLLLALEANRRVPDSSPEISTMAEESLRFTLSRVQGHQIDTLPDSVSASAADPVGAWLASADAQGTIRLYPIGDDDPAVIIEPDSHDSKVVGLAFSPRGDQLFSADETGVVHRWPVAASAVGERAEVIGRIDGAACALQIDPTGRWLAVGAENETLHVWDLDAPGELAKQASRVVQREGEQAICALAFDPRGRMLATRDANDAINVWLLGSAGIMPAAPGPISLHNGDVLHLAFSPDGTWLASGGGDGLAYLLRRSFLEDPPADLALGLSDLAAEDLIVLAQHQDDVTSLVFAPDGSWLATGDSAGTARIWRIDGEEITGPRLLDRHRSAIKHLGASPDSRNLVTIAEDSRIGVWQMPPGEGRINGHMLSGHDARVESLSFSSDGEWMVTGDEKGSVMRWALGSPIVGSEPLIMRGHDDQLYDIVLSPDRSRFASASWDRTVKIWPVADVLAGRYVEPVRLEDHAGRATAVVFAPEQDGEPSCAVFTGDYEGNVRHWSFCDSTRPPVATLLLSGIDDRVSVLEVSPDGRWLLSGDGADRLYAWDLQRDGLAGDPLPIPHESGTPNLLRFVDEGSRFLVAASDGRTNQWELSDKGPALARSFVQPGGEGKVRALAFDPVSRRLLVGSTAGRSDSWAMDGEDGASSSLAWPGGRIHGVALARNGRTAILAGDLPHVLLWPDLDADAPRELPVAVEGANGVALSPDGRRLAVAGADGTVFAWRLGPDGIPGRRVALEGHRSPVKGVHFLSSVGGEAHRLISHDQSGEIRIWELDPSALLRRACQAAGRDLSPTQEWPLYFPGEPWRPTCAEAGLR